MSLSTLANLLRSDDCQDYSRACPGCGMELEPGEAECCYLCSVGHTLSDSIELKGGGY